MYGLLRNQDPAEDEGKLNKVHKFLSNFAARASPEGPFFLGPDPCYIDLMLMPFYFRFDVRRVQTHSMWHFGGSVLSGGFGFGSCLASAKSYWYTVIRYRVNVTGARSGLPGRDIEYYILFIVCF